MFLLLGTWSTSEHDNEDYDFAIVEIKEDDAKMLATRLELLNVAKATDSGLLEMSYGADMEKCNFFSEDQVKVESLSDNDKDQLEDVGWVKLPEDFSFPDFEKAHTPEAMFLNINKDRVYWEAFPGESSITISTESLDSSILQQII